MKREFNNEKVNRQVRECSHYMKVNNSSIYTTIA